MSFSLLSASLAHSLSLASFLYHPLSYSQFLSITHFPFLSFLLSLYIYIYIYISFILSCSLSLSFFISLLFSIFHVPLLLLPSLPLNHPLLLTPLPLSIFSLSLSLALSLACHIFIINQLAVAVEFVLMESLTIWFYKIWVNGKTISFNFESLGLILSFFLLISMFQFPCSLAFFGWQSLFRMLNFSLPINTNV